MCHPSTGTLADEPAMRADAVAVYEAVCKEIGTAPDAAILKKMKEEVAAKTAEVSCPCFPAV